MTRFTCCTDGFSVVDIHHGEFINLPLLDVFFSPSFNIYLNAGFYQWIYHICLFLRSLFLCWNADKVFLLSLFVPHWLFSAVQSAISEWLCICVTILKVCMYIHLLLCGLLLATHGGARQLNTGGNCHSVCLWNPNVSGKGWDPELWNNVKAHCVCSAGEMSATYSIWRQKQLLACCIQLTWPAMWP